MNSATKLHRLFWAIIVVMLIFFGILINYFNRKTNQIDQKLQKMYTRILFLGIVCGAFMTWNSNPVYAQDVSTLAKEDPLKVNGNVSAGIRLYEANGIENRNDPFVWTTSGYFAFAFYGMAVPFNFMFSSQEQTFRQPFNRFGLSPHYKWIKVHAGYRNLDLSPYTLSGNTFLGAGVELTPGKFQVTAMYGRLRKGVKEDTLSSVSVIPSYRRMGYGLKVGYGDAENHVDIILFHAHDDPNSIPEPVNATIDPENNLALSVSGTKHLLEKISLRAEYATSAINRDVRSEQIDLQSRRFYNSMGNLFIPTTTVQFSDAVDAAIVWTISKSIDFDITYQRVDPGYRTLGTYFFNNDREQLSLNTSIRALENKLNVRAAYGTQRNNLEATETQSLSRKAGSISVNYSASPVLNFSANYSNFSSAINFIEDPLNPQRNPDDTLNIIQTSNNAGLMTNWIMKGDGKTHSIMLNANYQGQAPKSGTDNDQNMTSGMYNGTLMYRLNLLPTRTNITLSVNYNRNDFSGILTSRVGPGIQVSQVFLKNRLRLNLGSAGYRASRGGDLLTTTYNTRLSSDFRVTKRHGFTGGCSMINRVNESDASTTPSFTEYISTISYNYRF